MSFEHIQSGSVIRYPYLWAREAARGESEGRKDRPVAVGVRLPRPSGDLLVLFPVTSQPPQPKSYAVEIPEIERRRAGLDPAMRLWIIFDDYNADIVGHSYHLLPDPPLGKFSRAFFLPLMREFVRRKDMAHGVNRAT